MTISRFWGSLFADASKLALTENQIERLHALTATYHLALHRAEQAIGRAQHSLHSLLEDDTVDLTAVKGTQKDIETLRIRIQLNGIKAWREARGLLTPEQRDTRRSVLSSREPCTRLPRNGSQSSMVVRRLHMKEEVDHEPAHQTRCRRTPDVD